MSATAPSSAPALTARGQATRDRILDAAAETMHQRGVNATSIDEVKVAAGVSSSQLYHYFADKRDLVSAVIARQTELVLGYQAPLLSAVEDLPSLRAWRDAVVAFVEGRGGIGGCPLGSLASELSDADELQRAALNDGFGRWEAAIREGLVRMRDRGHLAASADPAAGALALLAALQGGLLLSQARRSADPMRVALDGALAGLVAPDPA